MCQCFVLGGRRGEGKGEMGNGGIGRTLPRVQRPTGATAFAGKVVEEDFCHLPLFLWLAYTDEMCRTGIVCEHEVVSRD